MPNELGRVCYRARFTLTPTGGEAAFDVLLAILQQWLEDGERDKSKRTTEALKALQAGRERVAGNLVCPALMEGTFSTPASYTGGAYAGYETAIAARSVVGSGTARAPQWWALEDDESGNVDLTNRWHTTVGVQSPSPDSDDSRSILVNATVWGRSAVVAGVATREPKTAAPGFVANLLADPRVKAIADDGTRLTSDAAPLADRDFEADFAKPLVDPSRTTPLVVVPGGGYRDFVIDPAVLAECLAGAAVTIEQDLGSALLRQRLADLFEEGTPSFYYRCNADCVRIYPAGIDLSDREASHASRYFTRDAVADIGRDPEERAEGIAGEISLALAAAWAPDSDEVTDIEDLATHRLREELAGERERLGAIARDYAEKDKGLDDFVDEIEAELERSKREITERYEKELAEARQDAQEARQALWELQRRGGAQAKTGTASDPRGEAFAAMNSVPRDLADILAAMETAYPDRILVTEKARRSAEEFDYPDDSGELWEILHSVPEVLWQLYWEGCVDVATEYQRATSYELARTEGKSTKDNPRLMAARIAVVDGRELDCSAHVKGKRHYAADKAFRLYYCFDRETGKVVINHCGAHLETAGSSKV
ncbi:MAG: hypothetical protein UHI81_02945 [Olegusella sp.]|nr:hypothetical protein [Olegusella sp.]